MKIGKRPRTLYYTVTNSYSKNFIVANVLVATRLLGIFDWTALALFQPNLIIVYNLFVLIFHSKRLRFFAPPLIPFSDLIARLNNICSKLAS